MGAPDPCAVGGRSGFGKPSDSVRHQPELVGGFFHHLGSGTPEFDVNIIAVDADHVIEFLPHIARDVLGNHLAIAVGAW